jgi:AcrR family transcriptional regulator
VRQRLLRAGRERFAAHGYAGVSTRTIAADAEAAESQIFTYFGSKAGLFEAAVLDPFEQFHQEFNQHWQTEGAVTDVLSETRAYVRGMFDLLKTHRSLVLALIAADTFDNGGLENRSWTAFSQLLPSVGRDSEEESHPGYSRAGRLNLSEGYDIATTVRVTFGAILSMTVLGHLLYDDDNPAPSDDHTVEHITRLMVYGFLGPR